MGVSPPWGAGLDLEYVRGCSGPPSLVRPRAVSGSCFSAPGASARPSCSRASAKPPQALALREEAGGVRGSEGGCEGVYVTASRSRPIAKPQCGTLYD